MKCPMMFNGGDVFWNGRECIGEACMWRVMATDSNGNVTKTCAVPLLTGKPGLSVSVQMSDALKETGVK